MPIDVSGFIVKPQEFEGIYKAADTLERTKLKQEQAKQAIDARRTATANFLKSYLDPKDLMSGTANDPITMQGLNDAMGKGMAMAAQGADAATITMALNPDVSKIVNYAQKAKTINASIDDQIKKMKESGEQGFDFDRLKTEALNKAFNKPDGNGGNTFDASIADPTKNYVDLTINESPELVTNAGGIDDFVKKAEKTQRDEDYKTYDKKGTLNSEKYRLIGGTYMQPEYDAKGKPTGMVPKYEIAHDEGGKVMTAPFKDKDGVETEHPIRMLDDKEFDRFVGTSRSIKAKIMADTKAFLDLHNKKTGEKLSMDDPKAKDYQRMIAYDELKSRSGTTIQSAGVENKQSGAQTNLNVYNSPEGLRYAEDRAAATARGRNSELSPAQLEKMNKVNLVTAVGKIFGGDKEYLMGEQIPYKGGAGIDITGTLPGGGIKKGTGNDAAYKQVLYDPAKRALVVNTEEKDKYGQIIEKQEVIPESGVGAFMRRVGYSNGIPTDQVKGWLEKAGYKEGKFAQPAAEEKSEGGGVLDKVKSFFKGSGKKETKAAPSKKSGKWD